VFLFVYNYNYNQLQRKPLGLFHWNLMWGYLWAIHSDVFSFSRFDLFSGLQAAILKIRLAILELTVVGRIVQFLWWVCLMKLHYILQGFLILPTFQGHRGQSLQKMTKLSCFFMVYNVLILCKHVYRYPLPYPWILVRSGILYGRQAAILNIHLSPTTPKLTTIKCICSQCIMIQKQQLQVYSPPSNNSHDSEARVLQGYHCDCPAITVHLGFRTWKDNRVCKSCQGFCPSRLVV
jgi:hypothetical protein